MKAGSSLTVGTGPRCSSVSVFKVGVSGSGGFPPVLAPGLSRSASLTIEVGVSSRHFPRSPCRQMAHKPRGLETRSAIGNLPQAAVDVSANWHGLSAVNVTRQRGSASRLG